MDASIIVPLGFLALVAGGVGLAIKQTLRARAAREEALREWAGRNQFQLPSLTPLQITGREQETPFVLEVRATGEDSRETVCTSPQVRAERLELMVLPRAVYDFSQGKLGKMLLGMAARHDPQASAKLRWLGRIEALQSFQPVPTAEASRFVLLARDAGRWSQGLSREVTGLLGSWASSKKIFDAPTLTLDETGAVAEVESALSDPTRLHHLIRLCTALARLADQELSSSSSLSQ